MMMRSNSCCSLCYIVTISVCFDVHYGARFQFAGTGYHLVVVREPNCDVGLVTSSIRSVISQAKLETVVSTEVTYLLPDTESRKFPKLFRMLDSNKKSLNISSFGASATTMEEVFLK